MTLQDFQDLLTLSKRIELVNTEVRFILSNRIPQNRFPYELQQGLFDNEQYISFDYRKLIAMLFTIVSHSGHYQFAKNKNKFDEFVNINLLNFPF